MGQCFPSTIVPSQKEVVSATNRWSAKRSNQKRVTLFVFIHSKLFVACVSCYRGLNVVLMSLAYDVSKVRKSFEVKLLGAVNTLML